jgi:hypothetical protein
MGWVWNREGVLIHPMGHPKLKVNDDFIGTRFSR